MPREALSAITGLGFSPLTREPSGSIRTLATTAVQAAVADAGLAMSDVDGLLLNASALAAPNVLPLKIQDDMGLRELKLLTHIEGKGSSVLQMIQYATLAVRHGMANTVACVFADAPIGPHSKGSQSFSNEGSITGIAGWDASYGLFGPVASYALAAQRYMAVHGVSHFGAYALACRQWAAGNPLALLRAPLTLDQYLSSRTIVEPFRVLDCAYPVNGGAAVIVTKLANAKASSRSPVFIHGMGQGHASVRGLAQADDWTSGGALAARSAYAMAGVQPSDVSMCQLYDAFSYCALAALEDYGLCARGEAAGLIMSGATSPGGSLPVNTGGGQLSSYYLQGMTPLSEAVIQCRGDGGARQVARNDIVLVNGSGGRLEYHAALIMSPHRTLA